MIHLFKHEKSGKFDIASIAKNGEYLWGTNQGYEKRQGVFKTLRSIMKNDFKSEGLILQDDTKDKVQLFWVPQRGALALNSGRPHKRYIPQKK